MFKQFLNIYSSVSLDLSLLTLFFIIFLIYGLYFGRNRLVSFILAFYPSIVLYKMFPFVDKLKIFHGNNLETLNDIGIFLIFFIPLNIIINRYISSKNEEGALHFFRIIGLSVICIILVLIFSYSVLNLNKIYDFSSSIDSLFSTPVKIFSWTIIPLILLSFL